MGTGRLFGEIAIIRKCKRTATVTATATVQVWTIKRGVFIYAISTAAKNKHKERIDASICHFIATIN